MAWSIGDYSEFVAEARDLFGIDRDDARYLYHEMRQTLDFSLTAGDLRDYADLASDIIEPLLEEEEPEFPGGDYDEDAWDVWVEEGEPGDFEEWYEEEWIKEGEEVELTADLRYKES